MCPTSKAETKGESESGDNTPSTSSPMDTDDVADHQHTQQQQEQPQRQQIHPDINHTSSNIDTHQQHLYHEPTSTKLPSNSTPTNAIGSDSNTATGTPIQLEHPPTTYMATPPTTQTTEEISTNHPHFARGEGVDEPLPTDVICGRGKMTASHPANRRFRELVDSRKAAYQNSKRRDEKTRITCELVDKLRGEGRFVLFDPETKLWYEVSDEYAREKVSHSLRSRSSSEQRANNASNSIRILNNAVRHETDKVLNIAPRAEGIHGDNYGSSGSTLPPNMIGGSAPSMGSDMPSDPTIISASNSINTDANIDTVTKISDPPRSPSIGSKPKRTPNSVHRKKNGSLHGTTSTKALPRKASSSTSTRPKHSFLKPGLDEIVKRLITDQQALLRGMIQTETERFTSAAAMGPPPRPMPLTYKAEASAVSTLTASLPKMGTPPAEAVATPVVAVAAPSGTTSVDASKSMATAATTSTSAATTTMTTAATTTVTATNHTVQKTMPAVQTPVGRILALRIEL